MNATKRSFGARAARPPVTVFGVPTDVGGSARGTSMGPEALRVAGIEPLLRNLGYDVLDRGNVRGPRNPERPPVDGHRHLDEVVAWNRAVMDRSVRELRAGRMPLMLGGDHSVAIGSVAAVARHCRQLGRALRVFWLDAHADFNTHEVTPSGNLHGMPVACLCGFGPAPLLRLAGPPPTLSPSQVRQIGIRSVDPGESELVRLHGVPIDDMRHIGEVGIEAVMDDALRDLPADAHVHVSFDVDVLDPAVAPGTGTPVPGGLDEAQVAHVMRRLAATGRVGSVDVVEVNPALDQGNATARLAVSLTGLLLAR